MAGRLAEKKVLLLGAGSVGEGIGNGRAMAILFAREGADIVGVDLNLAAAEETARLVAAEGRGMSVLAGDVTDPADLARIIDAAEARLGRIDILVNNVGGSIPGGPEEITPEQWDAQFRFNVDYVHNSTRILAPRMARQGGGAIVNISSIAAIRWTGYPYAAYYAAKSAVNNFTMGIALQYAKDGIRANAIMPGLMNTPLIHQQISGQYADADEMVRARDAACPMGHMGTAWDVANAALFLASDEAAYITGVSLPVDGGLTFRAA